MGKSGKVNMSEPANLVLVDERVKQLFKAAGWHRFLSKFFGENIVVAQAFAQSLDGKTVTVGSRTFEMTKLVIARATQLSIDGETWFKAKPLFLEDLTSYLKSEVLYVNWGPTVPLFYFKDEWQDIITTVQLYITCEGWFSIVHQYQMRFLAQLSGARPMNFPFFLHKSLLKMSLKYQKKPSFSLHNLYHRGLIKILIVYHLNHDRVSWEQFIEQEGFIYSPVRRSVGRPVKRQPKPSVVSPNQNVVSTPKPSQLEPLNRFHGKSSSALTKETRSSPRLAQIKATSSTPESKLIHKIYTRRQKLRGSQANKPSP